MKLDDFQVEIFRKKFEDINKENSRGYAWIDLNKAFRERKNKKYSDEYLAKELFIFLANWGMVARGAFLMQHSYRILIPVIKILSNEKYKILQNPKIDVVEQNIDKIIELKDEISSVLSRFSGNKSNVVSDTLLSKIIMGVFGCTVTYDTYIKEELLGEKSKNSGRTGRIASASFSENSLKAICVYYKENIKKLELLRDRFKMPDGKLYPSLKFLDMLMWFSQDRKRNPKNYGILKFSENKSNSFSLGD